MTTKRTWQNYRAAYREKEIKIIANWLLTGESGSVVGLPGCGRSNLLGFLAYRPDILKAHLLVGRTVIIAPVDLDNLPAYNLSTLYRTFLRAFYDLRDRFDAELQTTIVTLFERYQAERDPFLPQSGLHELFHQFQAHDVQIVLLLNRFDDFCEAASPHVVSALRGLRNKFRDTLSYLVGMRQPVAYAYLPNSAALDEVYELFDTYVCWVGAMTELDARQLLIQVTPPTITPLTEEEIQHMLSISGCFPALLRVMCHWWMSTTNLPALELWLDHLLKDRAIQHRLTRIWRSLTQEEQLALSKLAELQSQAFQRKTGTTKRGTQWQLLTKQHDYALQMLSLKGLCSYTDEQWQIDSQLIVQFVQTLERPGLGRIWLDEATAEIYQGQSPVPDLTTLERTLLAFLISHPRTRHTKSDLIYHVWTDELYEQTSEHSLYQIIMNLRKKIEPDPTQACYLVTWRARRPEEGGYQFFPEGKST
ncbi:MAG: winged helix-turn-helix domain-containing protein [Chloroflexota bacterium]